MGRCEPATRKGLTVMSSTTVKAVCWIVMLAFSAGWAQADVKTASPAAEKVAHMSDEEARQALIDKLEAEAAAQAVNDAKDSKSTISELFYKSEAQLSAFFSQISIMMRQSLVEERQWQTALHRLQDGRGNGYLAGTFLMLFLCICAGAALEWYVHRWIKHSGSHPENTAVAEWVRFCRRVLTNALLEIVYSAVFIFSSLVLFAALFKSGEVRFIIAASFMLVCYYIRVIVLIARIFFTPGRADERLVPLSDGNAKFVYRWIIAISVVAGVLAGAAIIFRDLNVASPLFQATYGSAGMSVSLLLAVMIWMGRKRVAKAIVQEVSQDARSASASTKFAAIWHILAIITVLAAGLLWMTDILAGGKADVVNLIISIFVIPAIIVLDHWMRRLIIVALGKEDGSVQQKPKAAQQPTSTPTGGTAPKVIDNKSAPSVLAAHLPMIQFAVRIVLFAFGVMVILRLWNIDIALGGFLTSRVLSILIIIIVGLAVWQFFKVKFDQHLRSEMPDEDDEKEEGGAGGSRRGTLLVLLRKFVFATLVVVVGLTLLSSLGVNIAPLIAGAGVLGLAIGFGAQTLVKDILSGVFFLIDDAFRVGDYIEIGSTKGTIEHISLRSLRLRHPRGMVHTIPFSDINTVTNFSRDYIITKLDFRVRYDADIDKIRKIIKKKVNKVIMANEELAPKLLSPIKSQGVRQMDDSAMIMRVKYKAIPGEQFVIRKEVYRLIQEAFQKEGIEFAHRNVTVYMPNMPDQNGMEPPAETKEKILQAGAGAIATEASPSESNK